jgi:hypothetical protein
MRRLFTGRPLRGALIGFVVAIVLVPQPAFAKHKRLGWIEWAWLQPDNIKVKTKLDSGAKTSSIHAIAIEPFERDGKPWVRFRIPLGQRPDDSDHGADVDVERPVVRETRIKEHQRDSVTRYVVEMDLCIGGMTFTTPMTLADRGGFNYPLLLGRSALKGRTLIDPARTFTASASCESAARD